MEERTKKYQKYLKKIDKKVIILVNNDKKELEIRVNNRNILSEFDKVDYKYNTLYLDIFDYMKQRNMLEVKMFLIDCTGLSVKEEKNKVKEIILKN